jgi:hypothetical protein
VTEADEAKDATGIIDALVPGLGRVLRSAENNPDNNVVMVVNQGRKGTAIARARQHKVVRQQKEKRE